MKRIPALSLALFLFFACTVLAQPEAQWSRIIGEQDNQYCYSMDLTSDGGFILTGKVISHLDGDRDFRAVKTDLAGDVEWERSYGSGDQEWCYAVRQVTDGGYALAGHKQSLDSGNYDILFIKTTPDGTEDWSRTYGGEGRDECFALSLTSDGGFVLAGQTNSFGNEFFRPYVIRTDTNGDTLWTRTFTVGDWFNSVEETSDGGFILGGAGFQGIFMVRLDGEGTLLWQQTWRNGGYSEDGFAVGETPEGDFILAGYKGIANPSVYLVKTTADGDTLWSQLYGEEGLDYCYSLLVDADGEYLLSGFTTSYGEPEGAALLIKTDSDGEPLWTQTYATDGAADFRTIRQTEDGSYALAGSWFGEETSAFYLLKTESVTNAVTRGPEKTLPVSFTLHEPYPNPFNPETTVRIGLAATSELRVEAYNLLGKRVRVIASGRYSPGEHAFVFNGFDLPAGAYFIHAEAPGASAQTHRVILVK